jgi:photosystem II stability/assembly factor-like uncharacterized protein
MQLRRSILLAICIVLFIYFEIHSCSKDTVTNAVDLAPEVSNLIYNANDVYLVNEHSGWVVGSLGTMMFTEDGGETWRGMTVNEGRLNNVSFVDSDRGWVVGKEGAIYATVNGGTIWEKVPFSGYPPDDDFYKVQFMNDSLGFVLGYNGVYRTVDNGGTWVNHWLPVVAHKGAWGMSLLNEQWGYLLGSQWMEADPIVIYKTIDGGLSWQGIEGSESSILRSIMTIEFIDDRTGYAGGGVIMKTADGGKSWVVQLDNATVRRFYFFDADNGFAVGGQRILRTTDGGSTWDDMLPPDDRVADLRGVSFVDGYTGWVVGRGNEQRVEHKIYRYSVVIISNDSGKNWDINEFAFDYTGYNMEETESWRR